MAELKPERDNATLCVSLLFRVLVAADGDAAVLHAGEKPYLVGPAGARLLAQTMLSLSALRSLTQELLPERQQHELHVFGATEYEWPSLPELLGEHFTTRAIVAQDELRLEVRRIRVPDEDRVPAELFGTATTSRSWSEDLAVPECWYG